jgi:hypothetical protein
MAGVRNLVLRMKIYRPLHLHKDRKKRLRGRALDCSERQGSASSPSWRRGCVFMSEVAVDTGAVLLNV